MELTISYLLKTAIVLLVLYLFYYALLRNQNNFSFNRLYLLAAPLVAVVLPLIKWPVVLAPESAVSGVLQTIQLTEVTVTAYRPGAAPATASFFSPTTIAISVYIIGALIVLLKLVRQLWQVRQIRAKATVSKAIAGDVQVYQLPGHYPTFAFGKAVYLSKQEHLNAADQEKILAHEVAHVQLRHTWDVLYFELLSAFLWLNPIVWLLKQELRDVHEYQADAKVIHTYRAQEYSALLSREVLQQMGLPVGSYFQKPQVLKRLYMLQQSGKQAGWLRPLLILPLLGGLLFTFSLQQAGAQTSIFPSSEPDKPQQAVLKKTPVLPDQEEEPVQEQTVATARIEKNLQPDPALPALPAELKDESPTAKERPYTYVEQMPQFEGGETEMLKYLAKNIRYPKDAQEDGVEGLVVVSFTVEDDGALKDIEVLKSLSESIDTEAVRVVEKMSDRWSPGMQNGKPVRVKYTLPVRFALK
ncbi:TonB family protein [Pontibacter locisalis]|uniref:TonB family protein n=1 Tax=Pontibacter locisalis TaxID=1719035 RepID=A0ABW5IN50_9BACT